jgi:hypothetical protein
MMRFQFAVNRVDDLGAHKHEDGKTISVDAVNEELARSIAREKLKDWSPGVQRFHPAELTAVPYELPPTPDPVPGEQQNQGAAVPPAEGVGVDGTANKEEMEAAGGGTKAEVRSFGGPKKAN